MRAETSLDEKDLETIATQLQWGRPPMRAETAEREAVALSLIALQWGRPPMRAETGWP